MQSTATDTLSIPNVNGAFAPLYVRPFRNIWVASLLSNFGQLILAVGAAWEMTRLTSSASMVALVQTATMLPLMLIAVPAGAIADMFDRRHVAMAGLGFSSLCAAVMAGLAFSGHLTPWVILAFCFLIGSGIALYAPSWQASIGEQVPPAVLPAAVALGTISYNLARSVGPAVGGFIVLAVGAHVAFAVNAVFFIPLLVAFALWKRDVAPSRLPPERLWRAIVSGGRYAWHASDIRAVLFRLFAFGMLGASATALAPLVAKDLLGGGAGVYGVLLGAMGFGAVIGGLFVSRVRVRFDTEPTIQVNALVTGAALVILGLSSWSVLSLLALFIIGVSNIITTTLLIATVQLSAPRWVTARSISFATACLTGGIAIGAWAWGEVAALESTGVALQISGVFCAVSAALGFVVPISTAATKENPAVQLSNEPEVALAITTRSGPVIIEIDYLVEPDKARDFYTVMQRMQRVRHRNGGFNWTLSRDIADESRWTERYSCPTWGDYLRMRDRVTQADMDLQAEADAFHVGEVGNRVTRRLERPFGSVRWKADTPDTQQQEVSVLTP